MKAVILAAGEGTRLRPFTYTRPKPLTWLAGKPLLDHGLEQLAQAGIDQVYLITGWLREQLEKREYPQDIELTFLKQERQAGTADALKVAKEIDETFLALNGDIIFSGNDIRQLINKHEQQQSLATLASVEVSHPEKYGMLRTEGNQVTTIKEKPQNPQPDLNYANAGIYVFEPDIFSAIDRTANQRGTKEHYLTDAIIQLSQQGRVTHQPLQKDFLDVGYLWEILAGNQLLLDRLKETTQEGERIKGEVEEGAVIKGPVWVGNDSVIKSNSYIEGPVYIGEGTTIGPHVHLRDYTAIADDCTIKGSTEVKNSVIMSDSNLPHHNYVGDSVVGYHVNLGAGTKTANLRHDRRPITSEVKGKALTTNVKCGSFIGDYSKTGINTALYPGVKLGPVSWTAPNAKIKNNQRPFTLAREGKVENIEYNEKLLAAKDRAALKQLYQQLR